MLRGNLRKAIAVGILAMCLVLALPDSAQARQVKLPDHQAEVGIEEGVTFWHQLWRRIESIWANSSVLIIPEGSSVLIIPEG